MKNSIQFLSLSALLCTSSLFSYDSEKSDRESFLKAYGAQMEKLPAPAVKDPEYAASDSRYARDEALFIAHNLFHQCILAGKEDCFETAGKLMARILRNIYSDNSYFDKDGNPEADSVNISLEKGLKLKEWIKNSGNFN